MNLPIEIYRNRQTLLIQALESGEYKQGKFQLYNPKLDEYCVLGVAREVFRKNCRELTTKERYSNSTLPDTIRDWFGWDSNGAIFNKMYTIRGKRVAGLLSMNDLPYSTSPTFPEIAQFLRKHPDAIRLNPGFITP